MPSEATPKRVQRSRAKGWKMPPNTVCVTRPGRWGNPFTVGGWRLIMATYVEIGTPEEAVAEFRRYVEARLEKEPNWLAPLRGKNLACWCPLQGSPCHADVLLELANQEAS